MAGGDREVAPYLRRRLEELASYREKGTILDLGCGEGAFVAYARNRGWNAVGVETSAWAAESGRKRFGVTIFDVPFEQVPIAPGSLDVVHTNHVLEHVTDPVAMMR